MRYILSILSLVLALSFGGENQGAMISYSHPDVSFSVAFPIKSSAVKQKDEKIDKKSAETILKGITYSGQSSEAEYLCNVWVFKQDIFNICRTEQDKDSILIYQAALLESDEEVLLNIPNNPETYHGEYYSHIRQSRDNPNNGTFTEHLVRSIVYKNKLAVLSVYFAPDNVLAARHARLFIDSFKFEGM
jgi:hypothetical protein